MGRRDRQKLLSLRDRLSQLPSMPIAKKINILLWTDRLLGLLFFAGGLTLGWFILAQNFADDWLYLVGAVLFVFLGLKFYLLKKISTELGFIVSQASYLSDQGFTSLYERSPVAYIKINTHGTIIECNPSAVNLLHGEFSSIQGLNFFQLISATSKSDPSIIEGKISNGLTINDEEISLLRIDGQTAWVMMSVYPYQDESVRMIALVDATERKVVDTAKSEFVALATHQLRTPIAAIRWNVELLKKSLSVEPGSNQERYFGRIERNVLLMLSLINDFLNISKLEMGTFATSEERVEIKEFFDTIFDEFAEKIVAKNIQVERPTVVLPDVIKTDRRLLHIIVSNLISNAVKYTNDQGWLKVTYQIIDHSLQVIVADNGIGIPEAEIEKLFTKFYRASNAHTHQTQGTGLGLYVVKQSVEKLGGTIKVASKENEGTTFTVVVPITLDVDT